MRLVQIVRQFKIRNLGITDFYGRPLREVFGKEPDPRPYIAQMPEQSLEEVNAQKGATALASLLLNLDRPDAVDDDAFNRILWQAIKG